ncbi:MAG: nuclear transport factor 2 (NTF2) superfamily protein [Halioglobus sp.]|jgi:nuclear transport factor 2 (NTF2) superfamily protein
MSEQLKPPFTWETAKLKVQRAEDLWNGKDPARIALAYTENSQWRNRSEFVEGRKAITQLLTHKWRRELDYRLKKELFAFTDNRIAVHFEYEYRDDSGQWFRAYGNENWDFDIDGLMQKRDASINEQPISKTERRVF